MRFLKPMRMMALSTVLLVVMTIVATISSGLVHAASLVTVSGNPSPYTGCSTAGQPGTVSVNAEVEPWVSVNPANPKNRRRHTVRGSNIENGVALHVNDGGP